MLFKYQIFVFFLSFGSINAIIPSSGQQAEIIDQHNRWRSTVDPPTNAMHELSWDPQLAKRADSTVQKCPKHTITPGVPYIFSLKNITPGQNYFAIWHTKFADWRGVIKNWAIRAADSFEYSGDANAGITNNDRQYSQLVWSRTQRVGCASFRCGSWKVYACQYDQGPTENQIFRPYPQSAVQSCTGCLDNNACVSNGKYSGMLLRKCDKYAPVPAIPDEEGNFGSGNV